MKDLSLVDRETKQAWSVVISNLIRTRILLVVRENIAKELRILTDEANVYRGIGCHFGGHQTADHSQDEYTCLTDREIHTNTVEDYFNVFTCGMKGTYQHCSKKHLHRYLAEFDFRHHNRSANGIEDSLRARIALQIAMGKRLTYRESSWAHS